MDREWKPGGEDADEGGRAALVGAPQAAPSDPLPGPGTRLAQAYVVDGLHRLGRATMTLRAHREADGHALALKALAPDFYAREDTRRRVERLHAVLARVSHPQIVPTLPLAHDERLGPLLCRPWVEGLNLCQLADEDNLTPRRICTLLRDVLSALAEAHRLGLVHGGLCPENVLVARDAAGQESALVCDFGAARLVKPLPKRVFSAEGIPWGNPAYMAPEQAAGASIDGRVDVYAVGAILYELLTGEPLFEVQGDQAWVDAQQHAVPIPPRARTPERFIPAELEAVCLKALAKQPHQRYASPRAMSQALREAEEHMRFCDVPLRSPKTHRVTAEHERMTLPGEPLRSKTKFWLGALLLLITSAVLWMWPAKQDDAEAAPASPNAEPE
jgi:serine/threonine protein kinase